MNNQRLTEIKAWAESDSEHPVPGELVAVVIAYDAELTAHGPFLCIARVCEPPPIWDYYVLLDQHGHTRNVNIGFCTGSIPAHVVCRYENRERVLADGFLKSYIDAATTAK